MEDNNMTIDLNKLIFTEDGRKVTPVWEDKDYFLATIEYGDAPFLYKKNDKYPVLCYNNRRNGHVLKSQKAWKFPDPPKGREWFLAHCLTEKDLPDGYRPLLEDELVKEGDEVFINYWQPSGNWQVKGDYKGTKTQVPYRTKRPLLEEKKVVPLGSEDIELGDKVQNTITSVKSLVVSISGKEVILGNGDCPSWEYLFHFCQKQKPGQMEWYPCSKEI